MPAPGEVGKLNLGRDKQPSRSPMTPRRKRFVEEYLIDLCGSHAAIRAGYAPAHADSQAAQMLDMPCVKEAVDKAMAERSRRTGITQDRVLRELARIAFIDPQNIVDFQDASIKPDLSEDDRVAIASVRYDASAEGPHREVKLYDKLKALELLGRHLALFTDVQVVKDVPVIVDDIPDTPTTGNG